jgi:hypothetical protein
MLLEFGFHDEDTLEPRVDSELKSYPAIVVGHTAPARGRSGTELWYDMGITKLSLTADSILHMSRIHRYLLEIHSGAAKRAIRRPSTFSPYFTPSIKRLMGFAQTIRITPAMIGRIVIFK